MADDKGVLGKQLTRGESLVQIVVLLIVILGVSQFASALSTNSNTKSGSTASSVGETGATGLPGASGADGTNGAPGASGERGANGPKGVAGLAGANGTAGSTGAVGATGIPGLLSTSYGQLSTSSQEIGFGTADEWVAMPFTVAGPSSNMSVSTDSPASITVQQSGVCQVTLNVYFSTEDSDEGIYTPTTYTLGVKINDGAVTPVAAANADETGHYLLNYSNIVDLSDNDQVQFFMKASDTEFGPFANVVTLENANAYLMQISD